MTGKDLYRFYCQGLEEQGVVSARWEEITFSERVAWNSMVNRLVLKLNELMRG